MAQPQPNLAKRMECVELAPAFGLTDPYWPFDGAGKPDALHTLREAYAHPCFQVTSECSPPTWIQTNCTSERRGESEHSAIRRTRTAIPTLPLPAAVSQRLRTAGLRVHACRRASSISFGARKPSGWMIQPPNKSGVSCATCRADKT